MSSPEILCISSLFNLSVDQSDHQQQGSLETRVLENQYYQHLVFSPLSFSIKRHVKELCKHRPLCIDKRRKTVSIASAIRGMAVYREKSLSGCLKRIESSEIAKEGFIVSKKQFHTSSCISVLISKRKEIFTLGASTKKKPIAERNEVRDEVSHLCIDRCAGLTPRISDG